MTSAERSRKWRQRVKAGRAVFPAECPDVGTEELVASFGFTTVGEMVEFLIALDEAATRHGMRLGSLLLSLAEELQNQTGEV